MINYEPLAKTLKSRKMTLSDVLKAMGTTSGTFKRYLNTGRYLSLDTIDKFCSILNCKVEDIIQFKKGEHVILDPILHCHVNWEKLDVKILDLNYEPQDIGPLIGKSRCWYNTTKKYKKVLKANMRQVCSALGIDYAEFIIDEVR